MAIDPNNDNNRKEPFAPLRETINPPFGRRPRRESVGSMRRWSGILLIGVSAAAFGSLGILGRYAYADGLDAITLLFLRFSLAAILMGVVLAFRREHLPRGTTLVRLTGMGALGYVGQSYCYLTAVRYASPGLVALLLYLYPVIVALLSILVLHEKLTPIKIVALGLALVGLVFTVGPEGGQLTGILLAISAAGIYSVYIMVGNRVMKQVSAFQSSTVIFASAAVIFGLLMIVSGPHLPRTGTGWVVILLIVLVPTLIAVATFLAGLARIGPTNAAMLSTLEPVVTVLLAAWLLGEKLKWVSLLGGGLILCAVLLLTRQELRRDNLSA
jgi:drug/metabolite transporter (DMT)-like permease